MTKYWVSFGKFAGVEVEALDENDAKELAENIPESEYEYPQGSENEWFVLEAEELED